MGRLPTTGIGASQVAPNADEVGVYVDHLLSSPVFASSPRRSRLLRYLVERTLRGEGERINEYAIGVDVFERPPSFDPRLESVVRTEFSRLRQKLKEYYAGKGGRIGCVSIFRSAVMRRRSHFASQSKRHPSRQIAAEHAGTGYGELRLLLQ